MLAPEIGCYLGSLGGVGAKTLVTPVQRHVTRMPYGGDLQGYLAHKKHHPRGTLEWPYA